MRRQDEGGSPCDAARARAEVGPTAKGTRAAPDRSMGELRRDAAVVARRRGDPLRLARQAQVDLRHALRGQRSRSPAADGRHLRTYRGVPAAEGEEVLGHLREPHAPARASRLRRRDPRRGVARSEPSRARSPAARAEAQALPFRSARGRRDAAGDQAVLATALRDGHLRS